MGKYIVEINSVVKKELISHYKSGNKATINKIEKILLELTKHPFECEGQPEELKHEYKGYWSRRINKKDRMVYRVQEDIVIVFVISAMGHYSDK